MKVGKTQKRIMAMIASDYVDAIRNGETSMSNPSEKVECRIAYKYAPFFLKEYPEMPSIKKIDLDGIPVESADPEWIADNIGLQEIAEIFAKGCTENTVSEAEKKN